MKALLFEQFFTLTAICVLISAIVFYYSSKKTFLVTLAISIILLAINHFVVTDKEAINIATKQLIQACKNEDNAKIANMIADNFNSDGLTKSQLLSLAEEAFAHLKLENIRVWGMEIHPPIVRFATLAHIVGKSGSDYGSIRSDWELRFQKQNDKWLVIKARPLSINLKPINSIKEIFSAARAVW